MRMFEADSTASARLVKIAFLKLYNRKRVRLAIDLMTEGGRAWAANAAEDAPSEAYTEIVLQNRSTQTKIAPKELAKRRAKNTVLIARQTNRDSKGQNAAAVEDQQKSASEADGAPETDEPVDRVPPATEAPKREGSASELPSL